MIFIKGSIEVIVGPMFSNKKQELLNRLESYTEDDKKIILIKPQLDIETEDSTDFEKIRNSKCETKTFPISISDSEKSHYLNMLRKYDVIGIDSVHFFDIYIMEICQKLRFMNKKIIVSGLDMDYLGRPFKNVGYILSISDRVYKLTSICMVCGNKANFSQRIIDKEPITEEIEIKVINSQYYEARCIDCFVRK